MVFTLPEEDSSLTETPGEAPIQVDDVPAGEDEDDEELDSEGNIGYLQSACVCVCF